MTQTLPYARPLRRRCTARLAPCDDSVYWGRCELSPHDDETWHALERGMVILRWSTLVRCDGP